MVCQRPFRAWLFNQKTWRPLVAISLLAAVNFGPLHPHRLPQISAHESAHQIPLVPRVNHRCHKSR